MTERRMAVVEGKHYSVTISDEKEALSAAYAAGGAIIGFLDENGGQESLAPAEYVVERLEDIDGEFLERVVRRRLGLPWVIAETKRLVIREFTAEDFPAAAREADGPGEEIFRSKEAFEAYIACQYRFYEYGIWALVEKESNTVIGRAGLCLSRWQPEDIPLELGYHIFSSWRRQGYGKEACEAILKEAAGRFAERICAVIDAENQASIRLAESLGFCPAATKSAASSEIITAERCSESAGLQYLYVRNCS